MNKISILRLDSPDKTTFLFPGPDIAIGRGSSLGCKDKRVSRNHGALHLTPDGSIVLEAYNINPCFYKTQGQDGFAVLMKGQKKVLNIGDEFSLLPHSFQYRLCSVDENDVVSTSSENVHNVEENTSADDMDQSITPNSKKMKRKLPQWLSDLPRNDSEPKMIKKRKQQIDNRGSKQTCVKAPTSNLQKEGFADNETGTDSCGSRPTHEEAPTSGLGAEEFADNETKEPNEDELINEQNVNEEKVKCEKVEELGSKSGNESDNEVSCSKIEDIGPGDQMATEPGNQGSSSSNATSPSRDVCMYGKDCFRKNPQHRAAFSHPGDDDYKVKTDLPECQYGTSCYRKNLQHRKDFKHTKKVQRTATLRTDLPSTSNVFCTNCTITYNVCRICNRCSAEEVIDLTDTDDDNDDVKKESK